MRVILGVSLLLLIVFGTTSTSNSSNNPLATDSATQESEAQIQTLQVAKDGIFTDAEWSPDFKRLAIASCKGLFVYKAPEMSVELEIPISNDNCILKVVFGTVDTLAFNTSRGRLEVWNISTQEKLTSLDVGTTALDLAFNTTTNTLLIGSYWEISLWDMNTHALKLEFDVIPPNFAGANSIAFDSKHSLAAVETLWETRKDPENSVTLWNVQTGTRLAQLDTKDVVARSLKFSSDGSLLAVGSEDGTIQLWDIHQKKIKSQFEMNSDIVGSLAFSPDGKYLAATTAEEVAVWSIDDGVRIASLTISADYDPALAFNQNGETLVVGGDDQVQLWKYR